MFRHAIVRKPGPNFAAGLTTSTLGPPDVSKALEQHANYCAALVTCGLRPTELAADEAHPDSTFVEDVAVLTRKSAILTRPGAGSRMGEVEGIRAPLVNFFTTIHEIRAPGTLDGGDICQVGDHFFIGLSLRTNEEGAKQLAKILAREGHSSSLIEIRGTTRLLHLKSGIAYLGDSNMVVGEELTDHPEFRPFNVIRVVAEEGYAANCLRINQHVLIPSGFPQLEASLRSIGYNLLRLEMSEFQKMDGGLSCLSLRF